MPKSDTAYHPDPNTKFDKVIQGILSRFMESDQFHDLLSEEVIKVFGDNSHSAHTAVRMLMRMRLGL